MNELLVTWAWTLVSALGLFYSARNRRDARRDRATMDAAGVNGVLRVVTGANIRRETVRSTFWIIAIAVGVCVLLGVDSDFLVWALVLVMALNAFNSRADRQEREEVRRLR